MSTWSLSGNRVLHLSRVHKVLQCGSTSIEKIEPTLSDVSEEECIAFEEANPPVNWKGEWTHPPFVIFCAIK